LGASPSSIISLIVFESVVITSIAGYLGMLPGIFLLEMAAKYIPNSDFFANPTVSFSLVIIAVSILIFSGVIASYLPARKAALIKPIEALRDDK